MMSILRASVICAFGVSAIQAQAAPLDNANAAAVAKLLERFDATASATGKLDPAARAALFSDDAIFLNAWGGRVEGRQAVDSAWRRLYRSTTFDSSRIELLDRRQRVLGPGLVLVDHLECLTGQRGPNSGREMPPRATHITLLLKQEATAVWRIVYYRAGDLREFPQREPACDRMRKRSAVPRA